jgi:hypothetical protein
MVVPDPLLVWEDDFPAAAPLPEQLSFVLNYAVLAISPYNTQPWRFKVTDGVIELRSDASRKLSVADPRGRALVMACGGALYHLRVALANYQLKPKVELLPKKEDAQLLARVSVKKTSMVTPDDRLLFMALPWVQLCPLPFEKRELPDNLLPRLRRASHLEGTWFEAIEDAARREKAGELVRMSGSRLWSDAAYRRELAGWVRSTRSVSRDGLPPSALAWGPLASLLAPMLLKGPAWGTAGRALRHRQVTAGPMLAVVGTSGDDVEAWLHAGQTVARLLLVARVSGVSASIFDEPMEIASYRQKLAELVGQGTYPQALLRFGYGRSIPPTPRRAIEEVLV